MMKELSKKTIAFIEKATNKHGNAYDYANSIYINAHTPVEILCKEHGVFFQRPDHHLNGCGCPKCGYLLTKQSKMMDTENFILNANKKHNSKYNYTKTNLNKRDENGKVTITCPTHGDFKQVPYKHLQGQGCPICGRETSAQKKQITTDEFVKLSSVVHNGKYDYSKTDLEKKDKNGKVVITCPLHGDFKQTPSGHINSKGCPKCGNLTRQHKNTMNMEDFFIKASKVHNGKYDYSKVDLYNRDVQGKICIICPTHGEFWQLPTDHINLGHGCPKCSHSQSKAELEIIDFLKTLIPSDEVVERNRELLDGQEVDILLPNYNIGIEFNGLHWHNTKVKPNKNYHADKMHIANSKGYRLIQIFEDEWLEHKELVLNKLKHIVNADSSNPVIGGRKVVIQTIDKNIARTFLNEYHIQGFAPSTVYLGAYHKEKLLAVMTFKQESQRMWNLTRFATDDNFKLPGVASKLFKHFCEHYQFNEIKSFLDLRWNQPLNTNTLYDKLKFDLEKIEKPDYRYVIRNKRVHKFNCRKQILSKKYNLPLTMTEHEMTSVLGIERIYDCGLAKYVYKKKD